MTPLVRRLVLLVIAVALVGSVAVGSRPSAAASQSAGKVIVISLSHQSLTAYNGRYVVWRSAVTTGNPALPTPVGRFAIFAKFHPFEFISPWPRWSRYWYPPSWTSYAMEFARGGYFIHDAPWRSVFGPGSNRVGVPGTNYGGTHGCVNVPFVTARFLYAWAPLGTPVDVIR
jgi:lipoprotein-anchoring transpeptidase ErfK/SrfK